MRIFGDPTQTIYGGTRERQDADRRWAELQAAADIYASLDVPHRWHEAQELGDWILEARASLKAGREIDLRGDRPRGLTVIRADNKANRYGQYLLDRTERRPIDMFIRGAQGLFVLTSTNDLVRGVNSCFFRSLPIWEGHTRDAVWHIVEDAEAAIPPGVSLHYDRRLLSSRGNSMCLFPKQLLRTKLTRLRR